MVSRSELISSSKSSAYHAVERIECNTCYIRIYHDVPPVDVSKVTKQLFFITSLANRCVLYKRINGAILKMLWKYTDLKSTVRSDAKSRTKYSKLIWTISGLEFSDKVDKSTDGLRMIPNHGKCQRSQKKNLITAFYIPK